MRPLTPPFPTSKSEGFPLEFLLGPQAELRTLGQNCEQTLQKLRTNRIMNKRAFLNFRNVRAIGASRFKPAIRNSSPPPPNAIRKEGVRFANPESENSRRLWLFPGSVRGFSGKTPGKFRENCWKIFPETRTAANSRISGTGKGKPAGNLGSTLPGPCPHLPCGVFFEIDSSLVCRVFALAYYIVYLFSGTMCARIYALYSWKG